MMMEELFALCKEHNITLTAQRKIVLEVVADSTDHPDVNTLYQRAIIQDNTISLATIYRTLILLEEHNIISKLDIGDGKSRYEITGEHHDHCIDINSGEIFEFHDAALEKLKEDIARRMGFELVSHRLELFVRPLKR